MEPNNNEDVILKDNGEGENLLNDETVETETIRKSLATEIARKKHWREKAEKSENLKKESDAKAQKLEEELTKFKQVKQPEAPEISSRVEQLETKLAKSEFARKHQLGDDETEFIHAYASGKKVTPEQAKEDAIVKAAIETLRSQKRAEQATPSSSTTVKFEGGKSWDEMDDKERKKNFSKFSEKFNK